MRSTERSGSQADVDIKDYYALNIGAVWRGLRQESWAFWWLCFNLFFEYVRPQSIYPAIDVLPWTQVTLILSVLTLSSDPTIKWVRSPSNAIVILFFLVVLLSGVFAFLPYLSWEKIHIIINWVVLYFLAILIINSEKRFFIFMLLLLLANFKMSQHGAMTFAMRGFSFAGWGVSGSPGWFQNAGDFGLQMTIFVPLAVGFIYALREYWGRLKKLFFYLLPLTGLITIVATSSRGAQLGLAGVVVWALLKSRFGFRALLWIVFVGWALTFVLPQEMLDKYQSSGEDETSRARLALWGYGMEVIKDNPVLGVGYENWMLYCGYINPHGVQAGIKCLDPHNTYIEAAAETGLSGFILYVVLILFIFARNARTRRYVAGSNNKFILYMAHGLDAGLIGYLISSTFVTVLFYPMIWMQLILTVTLHEIAKQQVPDAGKERPASAMAFRRS